MTAASLPLVSRLDERGARRALIAALAIAAAVAYLVFRGQWTLPHNDDEPLFRTLNGVSETVAANRGVLEPIRVVVSALIGVFNDLLASLGWPGVIGVAGAIGV